MNYYYITGASRGIGKAIAIKLLSNTNNFVFGISRSCSISHTNYKHINLDFSDLSQFTILKFIEHKNAESIVLINNAGMLGEVKHLGNKSSKDIIDSFNVNLLSPAILINKFIKTYKSSNEQKIIINISSGAAQYPYCSWSTYCSTKAGLDMYSKVAAKEFIEQDLNFRIFSIAPGIVETKMQEEIRKTSKSDFSKVDDFIYYKENNLLDTPENVANKIIEVIKNPQKYTETVFDFRNQ